MQKNAKKMLLIVLNYYRFVKITDKNVERKKFTIS